MGCIGQICPVLTFREHGHIKLLPNMERMPEGKREGIGQGFLIRRKGTDYNMPTQRSMEMMLFEVKERAINNPDGSTRVTKTTVVTGKGQQYFINKFLQEQGGE